MQFELTDALTDRILFAMEDQNGEFVLDAEKGEVLEVEDAEASADEESVYLLPEWGSADGFRVMEGFTASLRNPVVRAELSEALERGRGVFRAFKDVLSGHPEVERLWFSYKERQMRLEILEWYNALRETWGLRRIGEEPEETEDLVLEDFRFRAADARDEEAVRALHGSCFPQELSAEPELFSEDSTSLVAETARGELAGAVVSRRRGDVERIAVLDVLPEYRGLGVGEKLLERLIGELSGKGARCLCIDLPSEAEAFSRVLFREGFSPYETRYRLDLDRLRQENA